jgi:membrane fusion protein (multidrug efflux system)
MLHSPEQIESTKVYGGQQNNMKTVSVRLSQPGALTITLGLCAFVAIVGCGGGKTGGGGFSMPPMPVEVATATVQKVTDKFDAIGTIEANESITVVSEIDASIVKLPFEEGSFIRRGDLIAQLDDSQLAAEVQRANALHLQSQTNFDRVKAVVEQKAGSPQDLDDATATLEVAQANLALAKARFAKTRILAPFDGMIGARKVSIGTFLRAGNELTELANIDEIRVIFSAPERFMPQLNKGGSVTVATTAFSGYEGKGTIVAIEPVLDPGTRSVRVVARVPNPGRKFRPGMSANVSAVLSERGHAVTVPNEAVFASGNQSFVFTVKSDSTVVRSVITLGTRLADVVEVVQGLEPGMKVVRAGHQKLFDGAKVMPMNSPPAATPQ